MCIHYFFIKRKKLFGRPNIYVEFTLWLGLGACNESSSGLDIVVMQERRYLLV